MASSGVRRLRKAEEEKNKPRKRTVFTQTTDTAEDYLESIGLGVEEIEPKKKKKKY